MTRRRQPLALYQLVIEHIVSHVFTVHQHDSYKQSCRICSTTSTALLHILPNRLLEAIQQDARVPYYRFCFYNLFLNTTTTHFEVNRHSMCECAETTEASTDLAERPESVERYFDLLLERKPMLKSLVIPGCCVPQSIDTLLLTQMTLTAVGLDGFRCYDQLHLVVEAIGQHLLLLEKLTIQSRDFDTDDFMLLILPDETTGRPGCVKMKELRLYCYVSENTIYDLLTGLRDLEVLEPESDVLMNVLFKSGMWNTKEVSFNLKQLHLRDVDLDFRCNPMYEVCSRSVNKLSIDLSTFEEVGKLHSFLPQWNNVVNLEVTGVSLVHTDFDEFIRLHGHQVVSLKLCDKDCNDDTLVLLQSVVTCCRKLEELSLEHQPLYHVIGTAPRPESRSTYGSEQCDFINPLPELRKLTLFRGGQQDEAAVWIKSLLASPKLQELHLTLVENVTDCVLEDVMAYRNPDDYDNAFDCAGTFHQLTVLYLHHCSFVSVQSAFQLVQNELVPLTLLKIQAHQASEVNGASQLKSYIRDNNLDIIFQFNYKYI